MVEALVICTLAALLLSAVWKSKRNTITCYYCGGASRNWARRHDENCPYAGTGL